jgi:nucleoid-associated protein YgaU
MDRYRLFDRILRTEEGKRYLATNIPSEVSVENKFPISHIAGESDRLDTLAYRYYGDAMKWWIIARANNLVNGSIAVKPGTKLSIPRLS